MTKLKFKIYTLGCKVNQYDSRRLGELLLSAGWRAAESGADLAVINTCAVTHSALAKDRAMIKKAGQENPAAKIVVMGCWPKTYHPHLPGVDLLWGVRNQSRLMQKIASLFPVETGNFSNKSGQISKFCGPQKTSSDRSRYFIKVQDGCNQFCSYCVIPFARGRLRSRPTGEVLQEIKNAIATGYQEIVLSGIHLGLYGVDLKNKKINLTGLLKKILSLPGTGRLRLSSIEITEVTDELIGLMANNKKMCRHLHISLQSGCDKILKSMNRPYTAAAFAARVRKIRRALPDISITTDIIVGFPGETETDFEKTYEFAAQIAFAKIHVFSFSAHEKTAAFNFPDKVRPAAIAARSARLRELSRRLEGDYKKKIMAGAKNLEVVLESSQAGRYKGKTEFFFDVLFSLDQVITPTISPKNSDLLGKIIKIRI